MPWPSLLRDILLSLLFRTSIPSASGVAIHAQGMQLNELQLGLVHKADAMSELLTAFQSCV
jgi:hypothetical protein